MSNITALLSHSEEHGEPRVLPGLDKINFINTTWMAIATCLVFLMNLALGFFYGGFSQRKSYYSLLLSSLLSLSIVSLQWYFIGYSLAFSSTGSRFIGNFKHFILKGVGLEPNNLATTIPHNLFMIFQNMFATITAGLAFGGAAERGTLTAFCLFLLLWTTFVYDFIAYWTWGENGWIRKYDPLDFAGGTVIHVLSGFSAIGYAIAIGPRKNVNLRKLEPSSPFNIYLATALLWVGWLGFNGGCEYAMNGRTINIFVVTLLSSSAGGITWMLVDMLYKRTRKLSLIGFCSGVVAGLVAITPACGFVMPSFSIVIGVTGAGICYFAMKLKFLFKKYYIDDACDVLGIHGIGGAVGCILTGFFATRDVEQFGVNPYKGGWLSGYYFQMVPQIISLVVTIPWGFGVTYLIVKFINFIPFLKLKLDEDEQKVGPDLVELGDLAVEEEEDDEEKSSSN